MSKDGLEKKYVNLLIESQRPLSMQFSQSQNLFFPLALTALSLLPVSMFVDLKYLAFVSLFLFLVLFFIWPLFGFLTSRKATLLERELLSADLDFFSKRLAGVRISQRGSSAAYDFIFFKFSTIAKEELEKCVRKGSTSGLSIVNLHEAVHLQNRDPLRISVLIFCSLLTIISWGLFSVSVSSGEFASQMNFLARESVIILGFLLLVVGVSVYPLFFLSRYSHQREYFVDRVCYEVFKERYENILKREIILEDMSTTSNVLVKFWNKMTHSSYSDRLEKLSEVNTLSWKFVPFVIFQSYLMLLFAPLFALLTLDLVASYVPFAARELSNIQIFLLRSGFVIVSAFGASIALMLLISTCRKPRKHFWRNLPSIFVTLFLIWQVDTFIHGYLAEAIETNRFTDPVLRNGEELLSGIPTFTNAILLSSSIIVGLFVRILPDQNRLAFGLPALQFVNDGLLAARLISGAWTGIGSDVGWHASSLISPVFLWGVGEAIIHLFRLYRITLNGGVVWSGLWIGGKSWFPIFIFLTSVVGLFLIYVNPKFVTQVIG